MLIVIFAIILFWAGVYLLGTDLVIREKDNWKFIRNLIISILLIISFPVIATIDIERLELKSQVENQEEEEGKKGFR